MKTRVACDFIELNESILALPGGRAQIKPGVGLGISLAETTVSMFPHQPTLLVLHM